MRNLTLKNIARVCGGTYFGTKEAEEKEIAGAVIDSRQVQKDYLFIAVKGERVDGHTFIPSVFEKGALAVLSEQKLEQPAGAYILVDSTLDAMKKIAKFYRESLDIKVVGITGSVGKTSTKEMIASVLEQRYCVLKTEGNFNNEIGLPLTIFKIREEHEVAVLEMGISDFGDDKLSTKKQVNGKPAVFYGIGREPKVVEEAGKEVVCAEKEVYATDLEALGLTGVRADLHAVFDNVQQEMSVEIPIAGEHNVYNALAALCVGRELGLTSEEIKRGIETVRTISGRTNLVEKWCYNYRRLLQCKSGVDEGVSRCAVEGGRQKDCCARRHGRIRCQ